MYRTILIPLENSPTDATILSHVRQLARLMGSTLILMHVADGHAARNQKQLNLEDSEEIRNDRLYLEERAAELSALGFSVRIILALGEPGVQLVAAAEREHCDLIAMATHGHRGINDLILGSVASSVRHNTDIPVLLVRAPKR